MITLEMTKETMNEREMTCLTVAVGGHKKMVALDLSWDTTPQQLASGLRFLADLVDDMEAI